MTIRRLLATVALAALGAAAIPGCGVSERTSRPASTPAVNPEPIPVAMAPVPAGESAEVVVATAPAAVAVADVAQPAAVAAAATPLMLTYYYLPG